MGLSCAFDEAQVALQYGKLHFKDFMAPGERYEGNPKTYIYRFKRYAPYYACDPDIDKNPMLRKRNLAREILGRIEQADVDGGTHDAKILQTYLYSGCKVNAACELLGMHRNSVTYRLKHIEKTYDLDLNDPDERVFLSTLYLMPR